MPKRVNKAIELLEQGQPVFCTRPDDVSFEGGRALAKTWADCIRLEMEHEAFDITALGEFMRGLADGGPTSSGHRTPAVIVELPTTGASEDIVRANAWMFNQALARGVHGINLCHAETPAAVKAFVEACRLPFHTIGVGQGLDEGRRGQGGQGEAATVWGVSEQEYLERADAWPLNPGGELLLGMKIENKRALANAESTAKVPGVSFAEWGPGDMAWSLGYPNALNPPYPEEVLAARARVMAACKDSGVFFLNLANEENVVSMLEEGVMIATLRDDGAGARVGRGHTGRTMPV